MNNKVFNQQPMNLNGVYGIVRGQGLLKNQLPYFLVLTFRVINHISIAAINWEIWY